MKAITYFCALYLLVLGAPYWADNRSGPVTELTPPLDGG